jgi:hypothetical protein
MDKATFKRIGRNLWGWFAVCVWLVGVPNVLKLAYKGVSEAKAEAACLITDCKKDTVKQSEKTPEKDPLEMMGEFSVEEWKEVMAIREANKKRKGN